MKIETARKLSLAPMMEWTDRFYRTFLRQITKETFLYTEMVNMNAVVHGDRSRHLDFDAGEHPIALQLGGADPKLLAEAAKIGEDWGYDEINLNCGCPSDRVQSGSFGACLMATPDVVARCVEEMRKAVKIPVTVKTRLGIDHQDSWEFLLDFLKPVREAGCEIFVLHARKAWLKGLSPKENREKPPLMYERVHAVKEMWPEIEIILNGGVGTLSEVSAQLEHVDGVMVGRALYENPWEFAQTDRLIYGKDFQPENRMEVLENFIPYVEQWMQEGHPLHRCVRHVLGLFHGVKGGKAFRRHLTEYGTKKDADLNILREAMKMIQA